MHRSDSIADLAKALAKAQGQIRGALKEMENTYFRSKYADLASVWDACRDPLTSNELAVIQTPRTTADGAEVETILCHSSGQWISETLTLPASKKDAQSLGSAITYARRFALAAFCGVAPENPEDDDANAAVGNNAVGNNAVGNAASKYADVGNNGGRKAEPARINTPPLPGTPKCITKEQGNRLADMCRILGVSQKAACEFLNISRWGLLEADRYQFAVRAIHAESKGVPVDAIDQDAPDVIAEQLGDQT